MAIDVSAFMRALENGKKPPKKKIHKLEVDEWQFLQKGDVVRSIRGYGPYYENKQGEKVFKGEYGYFKISEVLKDGLYAFEHSPRGTMKLYHGGQRFIYMGDEKRVDCINRQPHKLLKVNV